MTLREIREARIKHSMYTMAELVSKGVDESKAVDMFKIFLEMNGVRSKKREDKECDELKEMFKAVNKSLKEGDTFDKAKLEINNMLELNS